MAELANLSVVSAVENDRGAIERLLQLYLHDSSEFTQPGTGSTGVDDEGLFTYPPFESYWDDGAERTIFLFRVAGELAGFAFINDWAPSGRQADYVLAEFFVLRAHRRSGVGWEASRRLFSQLPGIWEVGVLGHNLAAVTFWRTALRVDPIRELEEIPGPEGRWDGTVFRFRTS